MKQEEYDSLLGDERQRECDSLLEGEKSSVYHLESQYSDKARMVRSNQGLWKNTLICYCWLTC